MVHPSRSLCLSEYGQAEKTIARAKVEAAEKAFTASICVILFKVRQSCQTPPTDLLHPFTLSRLCYLG